jgi:hypothetical protein
MYMGDADDLSNLDRDESLLYGQYGGPGGLQSNLKLVKLVYSNNKNVFYNNL